MLTTAVASPFNSPVTPVGTMKLVLKRNGTRIDGGTFVVDGQVKPHLETRAPRKGHYKLIMDFRGGPNIGSSWGVVTTQF